MGSRRSKIQPFQDMGELGQQPGGGGLPGSHLCKALDCMHVQSLCQGARCPGPQPPPRGSSRAEGWRCRRQADRKRAWQEGLPPTGLSVLIRGKPRAEM